MKKNIFLECFFILFIIVFINIKISYAYDNLRPELNCAKNKKENFSARFISHILTLKKPRPENPYLLFDKRYSRGNVTIDNKTIVVFTGGGDVALNTQLAWIVRVARECGLRVVGVRNGYDGMVEDDWEDNLVELTPEIAEIMDGLSSTVLGACRRKLTEKDKALIFGRFKKARGIIGIGGNDHLKGMGELAVFSNEEMKIIGIPKSIDNDFWTAMHGYKNAIILGRRMAWWLADVPEGTVVVVEVMGRKSGSLTLDVAKGCPLSNAALIPEIKAKMDDILDAIENKGVKVIFISEGFAFPKNDQLFQKVLELDIHSKERFRMATDPNLQKLDAHGNPLLRGVSLYVREAIDRLTDFEAVITSVTYPERGIWDQEDKIDGRKFSYDDSVSKAAAYEAVSLINDGKTGLAITWPIDYKTGDNGRIEVTAKPVAAVYKSRDVVDTYKKLYGDKWENELAKSGVLGTKNPDFSPDEEFIIPEPDMTKEQAVRILFNAVNISTRTHSSLKKPLVSIVELGLDSETLVRACGKIQPDIKTFEKPLRMIIETTKDSVVLIIPKKYFSFRQLAKQIKKLSKKFGYVNIAISRDATIDIKDPIFQAVLKNDNALSAKFHKVLNKKAKMKGMFEDKSIGKGKALMYFDRDVSKFIRGLCDYLKIASRRTNLDYAFENLKEDTAVTAILSDNRLLAKNGVLGADIKSRIRNRLRDMFIKLKKSMRDL